MHPSAVCISQVPLVIHGPDEKQGSVQFVQHSAGHKQCVSVPMPSTHSKPEHKDSGILAQKSISVSQYWPINPGEHEHIKNGVIPVMMSQVPPLQQ